MSRETYLIKLRRSIHWLNATDLTLYWVSTRFKSERYTKIDILEKITEHLIKLVDAKVSPIGDPIVNLTSASSLKINIPLRIVFSDKGQTLHAYSEVGELLGFYHRILMKNDLIGFFKDYYRTGSSGEPPDTIERISGMGTVNTFTYAGSPFMMYYTLAKVHHTEKMYTRDEYYFEHTGSYIEHTFTIRRIGKRDIYREVEKRHITEVEHVLEHLR